VKEINLCKDVGSAAHTKRSKKQLPMMAYTKILSHSQHSSA